MMDWLFQATLGGGIRAIEALMSAMPTLLTGLLVASILKYYLGPAGIQKLFGGRSLRSLPQSWAVGMLLPVCSIGVLPILFEMRKAKVRAGAMSAFALSAPLFNPLSLLYGLTLSRPYVIAMFAVGSLLVVTIVGIIWDALTPEHASRNEDESSDQDAAIEDAENTSGPIGIERLLAMTVYACRQLAGPVGLWSIVAVSGVALLGAILPWGSLGHAIGRDDPSAPLSMLAVSIPVYATPMLAMSQLGMMFQHANSPGAAFILLVLGAGMNFGTLFWMGSQFGRRSVLIWFGSLVVVVTSIAYTVNRPLIPPGVTPADHTHAFDTYTNPIHQLDSHSASFAKQKLQEKFGIVEQIGLSLFGLLTFFGALFHFAGISEERLAGLSWWQKTTTTGMLEAPRLGFDRVVGSEVVGSTLIAGLIAISVVLCYGFYPSADECFEELRFIRADALSGALSGDQDHAKFWIPRWDQWTRRMEVGVFLRRGHITPYQRMQGFLLRQKLDSLEHLLEDHPDDQAEVQELFAEIMATNSRWTKAYRKPYDPSTDQSSDDEIVAFTQADTRHTHRHTHDSGYSHEHEHTEFTGAHRHDHLHPHRHADPPHGGVLISVEHDRHAPEVGADHLEVVQKGNGEILIYPLIERLGRFRPVTKSPGRVSMHQQLTPRNDNEFDMPFVWDDEDSCYRATVPTKDSEKDRFGLVLAIDFPDGDQFVFELP